MYAKQNNKRNNKIFRLSSPFKAKKTTTTTKNNKISDNAYSAFLKIQGLYIMNK